MNKHDVDFLDLHTAVSHVHYKEIDTDPSNPEGWTMPNHRPAGDESVTNPDTLLDRFDQAWRQGQCPEVESWLPNADHPHRRQVLEALLHVDLEHRLKSGQAIRVPVYLAAFPELSQDTEVMLKLLAWECELRRRESDVPAEEYIGHFPISSRNCGNG